MREQETRNITCMAVLFFLRSGDGMYNLTSHFKPVICYYRILQLVSYVYVGQGHVHLVSVHRQTTRLRRIYRLWLEVIYIQQCKFRYRLWRETHVQLKVWQAFSSGAVKLFPSIALYSWLSFTGSWDLLLVLPAMLHHYLFIDTPYIFRGRGRTPQKLMRGFRSGPIDLGAANYYSLLKNSK